MIDAIGNGGAAAQVRAALLQAAGRTEGDAKPAAALSKPTVTSSTAAMAAQGAPVDGARVAALRAAIADGSYRIDPDAIATKMIALDLDGGAA